MLFRSKTILITGCATGIGAGLAVGLAKLGADIVGISNSSSSKAVRAEVNALGRSFNDFNLDLAKENNFPQFVNTILQQVGRVDVVINNAGINKRDLALDYSAADFDETMNVNLKSPFLLTQSILRYWIDKAIKGKIVNILSL